MDIFPSDLSEWGISKKCGYLLEDPLDVLPGQFEEWNDMAENLPELIRRKGVRDAVEKLPLLDSADLSSYREYRLAHTQLAFLASAYVWQEGETGVPKKLPKQLAIPLWNVSKELDFDAGLNHASLVQANWKLVDDSGPFVAENIRAIVCFDGGDEFHWFVAVAAEIEHCIVPAIKVVPELCEALHTQDDARILICMQTISETISRCTEILSKMHERLTPKVFFEYIRPYLFGWGGDGTPLPNGLVFEGVSDEPVKCKVGGTSVVLDAFDTLAGIVKEGNTGQFIIEERSIYCVGHRRFVAAIKQHVPLADYVSQSSNAVLQEELVNIVAAIVGMRRYHGDIVNKYIHQASEKECLSPSFGYNFNKKFGTGANVIVPILESLIADSERAFPDRNDDGDEANGNKTPTCVVDAQDRHA